ncbi:PREDICTED: uncharacterized protein LOC109150374 [Ipomoea nil]|uniref:uncharacterized protein LOC109150374 n=1 Tax=Ipomoea nil TaxID=35883 RepID=UPI000900E89A|nr:PREDICTED: uncharacterized protein LOC109150374 [Ipomoea nil]
MHAFVFQGSKKIAKEVRCSDGAWKVSFGRWLIRDHNGNWVQGFMIKMGKADSYAAELWGLREGLRTAHNEHRLWELRVEVELDAEVVIRIMKDNENRGELRSNLTVDCCMSMSRGFQDIVFRHVFREGNCCADWRANMGQLGDWGLTIFEDTPMGLEDLIKADAGGCYSRRIR